jgi:predicted SAM-dependent methyltransferase
VILTEVFEHLHIDLIKSAREMRRVLRPGGYLYLTTPNGFGLRRLLKVLRQRRFQHVYEQWASIEAQGFCGHVTEYTPREMEEFFSKCGFGEVRVETKNVYRKRGFETIAWSMLTAPFRRMRETIVLTARK